MRNDENYYHSKDIELEINNNDVGKVSLRWNFRPTDNSGGVGWFSMDIPKQKLNVSKHCSNLEDELYSLKSDIGVDTVLKETDTEFKEIQELEKSIAFLRSVNCELEIEEFEHEFEKSEDSKSLSLFPFKIEIKTLLSKSALVKFQT